MSQALELKAQMKQFVGVAERTPTPQWLAEMDRETGVWLGRMKTIQFFRAAQTGTFYNNEMKRFHQQLGAALVFPFPTYLRAMVERTEPTSPVNVFARANEREERLHGLWWKKQASKWGIAEEDLDEACFELSTQARAMRDHLTRLSTTATIPEAVAGVNYAVESTAAELTSALAPSLLPVLKGTTGVWLRIHAEADYEHAQVARYCLITGVGENEGLQKSVAETARLTHEISYELYRDSYRAA